MDESLSPGVQMLSCRIVDKGYFGDWVSVSVDSHLAAPTQRYSCALLENMGIPTDVGTVFWMRVNVAEWKDFGSIVVMDHPRPEYGLGVAPQMTAVLDTD